MRKQLNASHKIPFNSETTMHCLKNRKKKRIFAVEIFVIYSLFAFVFSPFRFASQLRNITSSLLPGYAQGCWFFAVAQFFSVDSNIWRSIYLFVYVAFILFIYVRRVLKDPRNRPSRMSNNWPKNLTKLELTHSVDLQHPRRHHLSFETS